MTDMGRYDHYTDSFIQEPCDVAISCEAVLQAVSKGCQEWRGIYDRCEEYINALPPITPKQKTGHWIEHDTGHNIYYDCSLCGCLAPCTETADSFIWKLSKYCPDCGAKMESEANNENDD